MRDLFFRLVLAHLVGDFVLQFDAIYRLKVRGTGGLAAHSGIVLACTLVMAWPYLNAYTAALLIGAGLLHHFLDHLKNTSPRYPPALAGFLLDQAAHVVVLLAASAAAFAPGTRAWGTLEPRPTGLQEPRAASPSTPAWIILASGAIVATYVMSFIAHYLDASPRGHPAPYRRVYSVYGLQLVAYLAAAGTLLSHPAWALGSVGAAAVQLAAAPKNRLPGWPARWAGPLGAVVLGVGAALVVRLVGS